MLHIFAWLNVVGLVLSALAAVAMYYAPARVRSYEQDGTQHIVWTSSATAESIKAAKLQTKLVRFAPFVLGLGLALQLPAATCAALSG